MMQIRHVLKTNLATIPGTYQQRALYVNLPGPRNQRSIRASRFQSRRGCVLIDFPLGKFYRCSVSGALQYLCSLQMSPRAFTFMDSRVGRA